MSGIRIRAEAKDGITSVRSLITHPMESGLRKDSETDEPIPAQFIQELVCKWKDEVVLRAHWTGGVSKDPYLAFRFRGGEPGDPLEISWTDNLGQSASETTTIR
ncbi:thiosulfate oxidation carrier complex protein SoxZ [Thiococcus pfennigii]|jgi:sulfur-oxidizing protein SoxZ|uniref:thiosulfate oxidation carrier complex protein SoxZ n=1 Tax=Thiococcus pfennigii TaxID=1057 RepID=UPI001902D7FF|nr:thiosulfate oxidation carrier complex protein SoxZ [Thiococcus pfennigii]MBK1701079.1 thiosulfate oxidation carrier complex protein SoxZ [Thiococcus pfennigii]MBK1733045.1 thiosulfate oxidation carrier complex protein SoxZ [Thiococcus pfennigii]